MSLIENISRAFRHKNFRGYFLWQFLSFAGTWIQGTAQSWLIYRLTGSAFFLGLVAFASSLPGLLFSPVSGIVSDRFKKRDVLLTTQILCFIQSVILIFLFFSGHINKWHILILSVFIGIANSFDVTARQTFIPLLVTKEELLNAIALNSSMFNGARIIGPALAGILIAEYGEGPCFVLNAISYVFFIAFLMVIRVNEQPRKEVISYFSHFKEGILFAWNNKPIRALLLLLGTFSFWGMSFTTLMPIFSDQILHSGSKGLGILMGASGIGAVIGGLFLASRQKILGIKKVIAFASLASSVCILLFAFSKSFLLSAFLLGLIGFSFLIINAGSNSAMQAIAPEYLRGRIISFYSMMFIGMFPLGSLTVGCLAHKFGVSTATAVGATVCLIVGLYFSLKVPALTKEACIMASSLHQETG